MTVLPILLIAQAIYSGGLARLAGVAQGFAMLFVAAFWSLDGLKSQFSTDLGIATYPGAPGHYQPPILGIGGPLGLDCLMLVIQTCALLIVVSIILRGKVIAAER